MADTLVQLRPINSATFTAKYTVLTADATAKGITFDFQTGHDLVGAVTVTAPTSNAIVVADIGVSYPAAGKVRVYGTGTLGAGLVAGQVISLVAGINGLDAALKA